MINRRLQLISLFFSFLFQAFVVSLSNPIYAQTLRGTFPGRRVGGGTRGDCTSRLVIHLVPKSSQYSISSDGQDLIGLVQGPSILPTDLELMFRPLMSNGNEGESKQKSVIYSFESNDASMVLFSPKLSKNQDFIWESYFNCRQPGASGDFSFITSGSPPAMSMLTTHSHESTHVISKTLKEWKTLCGGSIPTEVVLERFELTDLLSYDWPTRLPILCP